MPHFYFHMSTNGNVERDVEGIEFKTLEEARVDAEASLFEMASEALARGKKPDALSIDICDEAGKLVAKVNFEQKP
ncbi:MULTISPECIES: DUF6894 family protein [unclassified Rhizobium]|uniref:DUF6894 family protein n=1 Tax=unclassified Rhizobium TaxID=2613769 RepID=UPI0007163177|nr:MULTISPECIES: hypothetical protein [unclassified Rhizobium]KQT04702.1 hypothetical protein ASG50_15655 [Rhizobium sp. Leaf386]KQT05067.1 hypothetical protein ASG42_21305 [Rhizobium sp. Leaf391]KQU00977.1 hypothetical protein ASG68_29285 [Rhizobium sp. Leaf453]